MELYPEDRARHRAALEGNPVFQEMRLELEGMAEALKIMTERNRILMNIARDHCPDSHGSLYIHMQPNRMNERGSAHKTSRIAEDVVIDFDSDGKVLGIEILNVPPLVSAAAFDAIEKNWRNG